ncbi:hypothetical protein I8G32_03077 [Rhodopseudomonas palustris]|uniref:Uncharacterized protein n=1 Tax=Rhodopseudomonas palustris (strain ATCC BAA-98 / CGA009) TaxID=258594 RepID=Q6N5J1_RHOPA|nr:hypothetical protein [Rhodopseudomonas palustris]OPF93579.1 hypothetical protein B1S06_10310 [Rhodopseudomonas palustris]QQM04519.1 hypothetical protein I8G32_03077 [Rhodopseudomonas palustris]RJF66511.1 hypothetical protein D4Q71_06800 [Rhodopseudomonas palustris]WAB75901.1 hypothetical protein OR798_15465 [Rhodopseudomonas palustris]WCL93152.1 hypothetical protein TX73_015460 [Rhodopseudomonas palustris CGA009]
MRLAFAGKLVLALSFGSAAQATDVRWTSTKQPAEVLGMPAGEEEADDVLRLTCLKGGAVQIGLGGYKSLGKGKSEPLSVALASGTQSVTLNGKSVHSKNFEMTGAFELRADLAPGETKSLIGVLTAGQPIRVSGGLKDQWSVKGLKPIVERFSAACVKN